MAGSTACMVLKQPPMLSVTISSNSSAVVCAPVLPIGPEPPATFTRMSMRPPKMSRVTSAASSQAVALVTSHCTTIASLPPARISFATGSIAETSRPISASLQPSCPNALLTAAPIPFAGPVITATRPCSLKSILVVSRSFVPGCRLPNGEARDLAARPGPCGGRKDSPLRVDQLGWTIRLRWQEFAREDLAQRRCARQLVGVDQNVDRLLQPRIVDI